MNEESKAITCSMHFREVDFGSTISRHEFLQNIIALVTSTCMKCDANQPFNKYLYRRGMQTHADSAHIQLDHSTTLIHCIEEHHILSMIHQNIYMYMIYRVSRRTGLDRLTSLTEIGLQSTYHSVHNYIAKIILIMIIIYMNTSTFHFGAAITGIAQIETRCKQNQKTLCCFYLDNFDENTSNMNIDTYRQSVPMQSFAKHS